jgi:ABC-2 type transport system permease protein
VTRLLALVRKEFLQLRRDTVTLRMIVLIPVMQTLLFGYAIDYDVKHLRTVVLDESRSPDSRELVSRMTETGYFHVMRSVSSFAELARAIDSGEASIGLVVDRRYGTDLHGGNPARALLVVNASDTVVSGQAMSVAGGVAAELSVAELARRAGVSPDALPVDLRIRALYNPDLRTSTFIVPGLIAILLSFTLIQFTAMAIVRERERGTLEQLQVTPFTRLELILGKILPYLLIGLFQLTLVVVLMVFVFAIPIAGSVLELYGAGLVFIAAVLGLGMLVSTAAKTQMQAMQMSFFFMLPFVFLSGYVFPIDGMPRLFQLVTYLIPARYFIEVIRGIVLRGAGLRDLWFPVAALVGYTVLIVGVAVFRFRKTSA